MYTCLTDKKNISIDSEMSTIKLTNSNGKQIFSDYVIDNMHTGNYCGDDESVPPTSSLKPKTMKALLY